MRDLLGGGGWCGAGCVFGVCGGGGGGSQLGGGTIQQRAERLYVIKGRRYVEIYRVWGRCAACTRRGGIVTGGCLTETAEQL